MGLFNKYYKNGILLTEEAKKKAQEIVVRKIKKKKCETCSGG